MYSSSNVPVVTTLIELPALVDNLLLLLSDKEKTVIRKRFGLHGKGKFTLEAIGQEFSVTRERVRQIEKNALIKMKRNVFNTALKNLHEFVAKLVDDLGGLVKTEILIEKLLSVLPQDIKLDGSSLNLSLYLHDDLDAVGNTINFHPYVKQKSLPDYSIKHASNHLINQLHKYGDVREISRIHSDLKTLFDDINFDLPKTKSLVDIDKRLTVLDGNLVGLIEWRHIHPRTLRDKILFILRNEKKSMHFMDIAERIVRENFDNKSVNLQAVHNELIRHEQFVLIGRGIYALAEWGYESGTVTDVVEKLLKEHGELDQDKIVDLVLKQREVKRITILLALKNGKRFARVGRRIYKIRKSVSKS